MCDKNNLCPECGHPVSEHSNILGCCVICLTCNRTPADLQPEPENKCKLGYYCPEPCAACDDFVFDPISGCIHLDPKIKPEPEMPLIDTIRIVCGKLRDECPFNNCGNCHACDAMRIDINKLNEKWLPAHDSAVAAKAVKEFAEKIDSLFLSKATPVSPRKEYDEWIITKQDWNSIVRAMAEGKE